MSQAAPTPPSWMGGTVEEDENNWNRTPKPVAVEAAPVTPVSDSLGLQAALRVVELGGKVIPAYISMKTGDKYPLVRNWANVGSRREEVLREWWNQYPYAWPGTVSGVGSLLCIDVDGPDAVDWFRELVVSSGGLGSGALVYRTPGRTSGLHVWFRWPEWLRDLHSVKYRGEGWAGEVQLRGRGCWTMMAGCRRPDGEYEVLQAPAVLDEADRCLIETFMAVGSESSTGSGSGDLRELTVEEAWERSPWTDGRKNAVAALAWQLSIRGASLEEVMETCGRFAVECCEPALESGIVEKKVIYTHGRAETARQKAAAEASTWLNAKSKFLTA